MTKEEDIDGLAAEYVLGSLDQAERAHVDTRRRTDALLTAAIVAWERRLGPLSEQVPGVAPPPQLWMGVLSRISRQEAQSIRSAEVIPMPANPRRWRQRAIGTAALAACLVLAVSSSINMQSDAPMTQVTGMDCRRLYKDFWGKFDRQNYARMSAEQLSGVSRMALRAYDACQAGDQADANTLFDRLKRLEF